MSVAKTRRNSTSKLWQKWSLAVKIMPLVLLTAILKFLTHHFGWEVMELNALFSSLVAGTLFLIGFLITGVLSDYKESEKLPGELAAVLKNLCDDTYTILRSKNSATAQKFLHFHKSFLSSTLDWFFKKEKSRYLLSRLSAMNDFFVEFEKEGIQANYIIKLKNEQGSIRKILIRMHTIRDTGFVGSAYAIVEVMAFLIAIGLIILKIEPFYVSLFCSLLVVFLMTYMIFLIRDLDNPFDYVTNGENGNEIPLYPLHDLELELNEMQIHTNE